MNIDETQETYTVAQIREAFAKHASRDDWNVKHFYETTLIAALRGEYDDAEPTACKHCGARGHGSWEKPTD